MIFAVTAVFLAMVELVAIAAKLDNSTASQLDPRPSRPRPRRPRPLHPRPLPPRRIGVTLKEYSVAPSPTVGSAGQASPSRCSTRPSRTSSSSLAPPSRRRSLLKGAEADEAGNVGEIGDLQPGEAKTLSLSLKPGHYALICNLPGHYKAGQHADFTVR